MSIWVRCTFYGKIVEDERYIGGCNWVNGKKNGATVAGRFNHEGKRYFVWHLENLGYHVEMRLEEGARNLPAWIPPEHVSTMLLISTFCCAKLRATGRYWPAKPSNGRVQLNAEGVLTRRIPAKELAAIKGDGSFIHGLALLARNRVRIEGHPSEAFKLYYDIRTGAVAPYENWDEEQR